MTLKKAKLQIKKDKNIKLKYAESWKNYKVDTFNKLNFLKKNLKY